GAPPLRRPQAPFQHLAISRALGTFSLRLVRQIVEDEHLGRIVYAGGDDVLALLSFRDAVPATRCLRAAFSGQIAPGAERVEVDWGAQTGYVDLDGAPALTMGPAASASAGIALAHFKHALSDVVAAAKEAERYAKDVLGRDHLVLSVLKRSGEAFMGGVPWTTKAPTDAWLPERVDDLAKAVERYAALVRHGLVSTRLPYVLAAERTGLDVFEQDTVVGDHDGRAAVLAEVRRLFLRHTEQNGLAVPAPPDLDWLGSESGWETRAYEATAGLLVRHLRVEQLERLLDAAQFIGLGGAR
ncbi:MAG: hypothetical protein AAFQ53_18045, partial [Bacteroidota bacterium]